MSDVDEVRAAADIVKIAGDYLKLRKAGANYVGLCPFHQEKTPSFAVHPVKQIFHCFGCGVGGDVFKFIMLIEGLSFPEALERVAERVGVKLQRSGSSVTHDAHARERTALYKIHEEAAKFYAAQMSGTAEGRAARAYLADRGVSDESVGRFRLGYAPADGQSLSRRLSQSGFPADLLETSGLMVSAAGGQRGHDRFRRRIVFPIANESRKIVAFGGRAMGDDEPPKYLNSPETPIYSKGRILYHLDAASSEIRTADEVLLVEGYMDCIAVESCGIANVVASCGTSLTEAQVRLMSRFTRRVIVNFDPDSAGMAATERSLELLLGSGFNVRVLALPGGLDPDSFVRKRGPAAYLEAIRKAPGYLDYLADRAIEKHGLHTPEGKVAAANALMPYLSRIPDPLMRREVADRLAARLRIDDRVLREQLKQAATERRHDSIAIERASAGHGERKLLRAFLESEELLDRYLPHLAKEGLLQGLASEEIFRKLLEARQSGEMDVHRLEERLSPAGQAILHECLLGWGEAQGEAELAAFCDAWRREKLDQKRLRIQVEIEEATRCNDSDRLAELMRAKVKFLKDLAEARQTANFFYKNSNEIM